MADFYRHGLIFGGVLHSVESTLEEGRLHSRLFIETLGDGLVFKPVVAWRGAADDIAHVGDRKLGRCMGNFPIAFGPDGFVYIQHNDRGALDVYSLTGVFQGRCPAPYAAEGIDKVLGPWDSEHPPTVRMLNDPSRFRTLPNGEFGHNVEETANFIGYQFGRDPDFGGSVSLYDKRTGVTKRWLGYTPHPFTLLELDGEALVLLSGRDTPGPFALQWAANFPPLQGQPPAPPPPPIVTPPPAPADCNAEREKIAALTEELSKSPTWQDWAKWWQFVFYSGGQHPYADVGELRAAICKAWGKVELRAAAAEDERDARLTPEQVIKLVNDATGKMAGYWRYLGVQGAVDRAVKAELAKRKP